MLHTRPAASLQGIQTEQRATVQKLSRVACLWVETDCLLETTALTHVSVSSTSSKVESSSSLGVCLSHVGSSPDLLQHLMSTAEVNEVTAVQWNGLLSGLQSSYVPSDAALLSLLESVGSVS